MHAIFLFYFLIWDDDVTPSYPSFTEECEIDEFSLFVFTDMDVHNKYAKGL